MMTTMRPNPLVLALLVGCSQSGSDTGDSDADTDTDTGGFTDEDGDGYPDWRGTDDPLVADCDDGDPTITPHVEVYVPAGPFTRGQVGVEHAEPVRTITLSAFCIDRTEVSNRAFRVLLAEREEEGAANVDDEGQPLFDVWDADDTYPERLAVDDGTWTIQEGYDEHPVAEVWEWSAEFYCARRGQSVPTEAQWEKAARGTDARVYPWGDDPPDCGRTNFTYIEDPDGDGVGEPRPCVGDTTPVDDYPDGAGPTGVTGLAGSVAEWVSDWFDPDAYSAGPDTDPTGPEAGSVYNDGVGEFIARVDRGGNYLTSDDWIGVSARFPEPEDATSNGVGFRCARPLR